MRRAGHAIWRMDGGATGKFEVSHDWFSLSCLGAGGSMADPKMFVYVHENTAPQELAPKFLLPEISGGVMRERIPDAVNKLACGAVSFLATISQMHSISIGGLCR